MFESNDKVRVLRNEDDYHKFQIGELCRVVAQIDDLFTLVRNKDDIFQYVLNDDIEKVKNA